MILRQTLFLFILNYFIIVVSVCACVYKHTGGSMEARGELLGASSPYTSTWIPGIKESNSDSRFSQQAP